MDTTWITNTIYVGGFTGLQELYNFFITIRQLPRNEDGDVLIGQSVVDLQFLSANASLVAGHPQLAINFLSSANIARHHGLLLTEGPFSHLRLSYMMFETTCDSVMVYHFLDHSLVKEQSLTKSRDRHLIEELERLPAADANLNLTSDDLDFMEYEEFTKRFPRQ